MSPYGASVGRLVRAPAAEVFGMWLSASRFHEWMTPRPQAAVVEAQADPIVGGALLVVMRANGREETHEGRFLLIDPVTRLRFTWTSGASGGESIIEVRLHDTGGGETMVLLRHDHLPTNAARENHREGWRRILDNLAKVLEGQHERAKSE